MCEQQRLEAIIEKKQLLKKIEELQGLVSLVKGKHVRACEVAKYIFTCAFLNTDATVAQPDAARIISSGECHIL